MIVRMDTTTITRMWLTNGKREPRSWRVQGSREKVKAEVDEARADRRFANFLDADERVEFSISTDRLTVD